MLLLSDLVLPTSGVVITLVAVLWTLLAVFLVAPLLLFIAGLRSGDYDVAFGGGVLFLIVLAATLFGLVPRGYWS